VLAPTLRLENRHIKLMSNLSKFYDEIAAKQIAAAGDLGVWIRKIVVGLAHSGPSSGEKTRLGTQVNGGGKVIFVLTIEA
jgi:hypothetical protein